MNDLVSDRSSPLGQFPGQAALRLYDWAMEALRRRHYSRRTEQTYLHWIHRFVEFHGGTHPRELAESDVNRFLTDLAVTENVAAPTQNQAPAAVLFLYEHILERTCWQQGKDAFTRMVTLLRAPQSVTLDIVPGAD